MSIVQFLCQISELSCIFENGYSNAVLFKMVHCSYFALYQRAVKFLVEYWFYLLQIWIFLLVMLRLLYKLWLFLHSYCSLHWVNNLPGSFRQVSWFERCKSYLFLFVIVANAGWWGILPKPLKISPGDFGRYTVLKNTRKSLTPVSFIHFPTNF